MTDEYIPRVEDKVYNTVVRTAMMYGAETWTVKKTQEKKLDVAEKMVLRWMCGVAKLTIIRNERIRGIRKVEEMSKNVQKSRIAWYVMRRENEYVGKRILQCMCRGKEDRIGSGWHASSPIRQIMDYRAMMHNTWLLGNN